MESPYERRPWLGRYPGHVPPDLTPPHPSAVAMFRAAARAAPEAPAIHYFEGTTTFAELDRASDALAAAPADRGVARGDRVAVDLQNVPQFPLAVLAAWKAGASVVPLNPMFKVQEVRYHLADSGARALISLESLFETVGREAAEGTEVRAAITTCELDQLQGQPPPGLAGVEKRRPEGAEDLVELVRRYDGRSLPDPGLGPDDVAFLAGLPMVLFHRFEPQEALRMIERWRCTFTVATITAYLAMMAHPDIETRDLSSFRKAYSGGAPVSPATVERFERLTGAYIHNVYGLTETTSPSHAVPLGARAPVDPDSGALSVGVPVPGTTVKVVDVETGREVPVGEVGELWTRGPEVVPGYWRRPEATAETFTDGYLHTGDVGRMDAEGWFYIVDRAKDMINASGYKVWPREVEDFLYQHPAVREAAVVGVPDPYRGETVKAFVSLRPGTAATPEELVAFCRERMAAYKCPRVVEVIDEVPKTATGKFLRRELRDRERARASSQG